MDMELNEKSIELWCEELDKEPRVTQLSRDECEFLMYLALNEHAINKDDELFNDFLSRNKCLLILQNRVKTFHTYSLSNTALLFLGIIVESPGISTMVANYLQYKSIQKDKSKFELDDLTNIFALGIWNKDTINKFWELQKIRGNDRTGISDNMLDYPELYGKSLNLKCGN